jgi:hypothetical protein
VPPSGSDGARATFDTQLAHADVLPRERLQRSGRVSLLLVVQGEHLERQPNAVVTASEARALVSSKRAHRSARTDAVDDSRRGRARCVSVQGERRRTSGFRTVGRSGRAMRTGGPSGAADTSLPAPAVAKKRRAGQAGRALPGACRSRAWSSPPMTLSRDGCREPDPSVSVARCRATHWSTGAVET